MSDFLTKEAAYERIRFAQSKGIQPKQALVDLANAGYEIEGWNAEFSPLEAIKNVPQSSLEYGKAIWSAIKHPIQTVSSISSLAKGAIGKLGIPGSPTEQGQIEAQNEEKLFDEMVGFFIDRYGSKDKALNTIEKDPVGFLADVASVLGGTGFTIKTVGKVGKITKITETGNVMTKYSRILEPTTAATKTAGLLLKGTSKISESITPGINQGIRNIASRFMAKGTGLSASERANIAKTVKKTERTKKIAGKDIQILKKPEDWLAEHGIHGSLDDMHSQVSYVEYKTVDIVDDLLASVDDIYKNESATKFLTELRNSYGKLVDDIADGNVKESVFISKENLSKVAEQNLSEIKSLLQKSQNEGLTLTELNKTKRIGDRILNIYDRSGEAKSAATAQNLSELRSEVREFIEIKAKEKGIPDIRELNQQTQMSMLIKKGLEDILQTTETRSAIGDQLIFMMGLTGTVASGGIAPVLGGAVVVGGREIVRFPKVRTFIATRLRLMSDSDYSKLLRSIQTGKIDAKTGEIIRREKRLLRKALPELRLSGITKGKMKEISDKELMRVVNE